MFASLNIFASRALTWAFRSTQQWMPDPAPGKRRVYRGKLLRRAARVRRGRLHCPARGAVHQGGVHQSGQSDHLMKLEGTPSLTLFFEWKNKEEVSSQGVFMQALAGPLARNEPPPKGKGGGALYTRSYALLVCLSPERFSFFSGV
jgi:hypothetical protein